MQRALSSKTVQGERETAIMSRALTAYIVVFEGIKECWYVHLG
jgi:hypothetical protein